MKISHRKPSLAGFLLSFLLLASAMAWAVPAKRGQWRTLTLASGQTVRAEARGDEAAHYWQTESGDRYVLDEETGLFVPISDDSIASLRQARRLVQSGQTMRRAAASGTAQTTIPGATGPYLGKKKGLVILVEFSNQTFSMSDPKSLYTRILNEEGYSEGSFKASVADYFKAQSGGLFELEFDVVGPITLSQPYSYYGRNDEANAPIMAHDACVAVDDEVNFADYDWDDDGEAEEVFVLYAGYGEADNSSQTSLIWPHMYELSAHTLYKNNPLVLDGTTIDVYACANELMASGEVNGIGTFCHEFSHCLGFPDFYDTSKAGTGFGLGAWSLLDYGSYNGNGFLPAGYTAYEKICAGWMDPIELSADTTIALMAPVSEGGQGYLLRHPSYKNEFLVIDNRQKTGFDAGLYGAGMLVTHVAYDPDLWANNELNSSNNSYQHCTIYHADNRATNQDHYGDPYPYNGLDSLTDTSTPALAFHMALSSGRLYMPYGLLRITQLDDGNMQFTLRVVPDTATVQTSTDGVLLHETFDLCAGIGGNDNRFSGSVASAAFQPDLDGWKYTTAAYGGLQCARFGKGSGSASTFVTTPSFTLTGDTATLSFSAAGWNATGDGTSLLLTLTGTNARFADNLSADTMLTMVKGQWTAYELRIVGTGATTLVFNPARRFFLDEVLVSAPVGTAISTVRTAPPAVSSQRIYSLDGRYLGTNLQVLPPGIYIQGRKKVVR